MADIPNGPISRFGIIPKKHHANNYKWRLIVNLSHPAGHSVNDGISSALCSLNYVILDDAIQQILNLGRGCMLAKIDIQSAFRLLPVHPADRHLLLMKWNGNICIDMCMPFGLRSAPKLFNVLVDLLKWIARAQSIYHLLHYLDDFMMVGPPITHTYQSNLDTTIRICKDLGVPLAVDKIEGPSSSLPFQGIMLDTNMMEARLPLDKLNRTFSAVTTWLKKKKATKRDILSLVGSL